MNTWEIVALPQGDEIMKNGKVADTREAERILNNHEKLVEALRECERELAKLINGNDISDGSMMAEMQARTLLAALEAEKGGEL